MKRSVIFVGAVLALIAAALASLPLLLSSEPIKQQAIKRLTQLTGRTAVIKGASSVSIFPYLQIKFSDVDILDSNPAASHPLVSMDRLETRLELLPLLFGHSEFSKFRLIRPRFNLHENRFGSRNWQFRTGDIATYLQQLEFKISGLDQAVKLGSFTLIDGIVRYQNDRTRKVLTATAINLTATWPEIDGRLILSGTAVWNGEVVEYDADISDPRKLIEGKESPISASMTSRPVNWSFSGKGDTRAGLYLEGEFSVRSASVRRLFEWTNQEISAGNSLGALTIDADLVSKPGSLQFQNARLSLDGNDATGIFELNFPGNGKPPAIVGTLAYDVFDVSRYFKRVVVAKRASAVQSNGIDFTLLREFDLDLRISANTAKLAKLEISNMAATAQVRDGRATVDIGAGTIFGGVLQGQLIAEQINSAPHGELKASFSAISLAALSRYFSSDGMKLSGPGSATIDVKSFGRSQESLIKNMNGRAEISAQNGRVDGLDLAQLVEDAPNEIILDANKVLAKGTDFDSLELKLEIANGIAFLDEAGLVGQRIGAILQGRTDLFTESLVLNGKVLLFSQSSLSADGSKPIETEIPFLIGGTLAYPLIAPDFLRIDKKSALPQPFMQGDAKSLNGEARGNNSQTANN